MSSSLPSPPMLKTTIIQLNKDLDNDDNNYEILTNEWMNNGNSSENNTNSNIGILEQPQAKKKRRRSSANIDSEELAKRKHETKQLHSIIEKRRRIKINREFEALKYLIPACRSSNEGSISNTKKNFNSNNNNKIDGMYKLTILKSSVEYILYLHHIIEKQHALLSNNPDYSFDINFCDIPLNVNQYRNIDKEFSFKDLIENKDLANSSNSSSNSSSPNISPANSNISNNNKTNVINDSIEEHVDENDEKSHHNLPPLERRQVKKIRSTSSLPSIKHLPPNFSKNQLPSPEITPDMAPILSMLNKYSNSTNSSFSFTNTTSLPNDTRLSQSTGVSPFTKPLRSSFSKSNTQFQLPDPAITSPSQYDSNYPRKKFFKSKIPANNTIIQLPNNDSIKDDGLTYIDDSLDVDDGSTKRKLSEKDASKTLLALRKSSIDNLLN